MRLAKLIERVTELRGQQYDTEILTGWVNEIEGQAVDEVIGRCDGGVTEIAPYDYNVDAERELLIPDRFQDVYVNYVLAKMDLHNQETERYNNDVSAFNAAYDAFGKWFFRSYMPKAVYFSKF